MTPATSSSLAWTRSAATPLPRPRHDDDADAGAPEHVDPRTEREKFLAAQQNIGLEPIKEQ
jgi:hypothetical protein